MARRILRITLVSIAFFILNAAWAAGDYPAWNRSADLSLNTSPEGAGIAGTVTGFPLLVRLTADNFDFGQARPDGGDIRFAKPDGTPLPYEIEHWDATLRAAEIWVRIDTLRGNDAAQSIRMYWGNGAAADDSKGSAVFATADGYLAAWHLGGSGTAARPNSAGGNPATPSNYGGDEGTGGVIAGADSLDGAAAGDHLGLGNGYAELSEGMTFTIWAFPTAAKAWSHLIDLGNGESADNVILGRWDTTSGLTFIDYSGANHSALDAPEQLVLNQWQMLGVTVTGKSVRLYRNGVPVLSDTLAFPISNVTRYFCYLGRSNAGRGEYYQGKLDEAELSKTARSADWMKLMYQNQKPGQVIPTLKKAPDCAMRFAVPGDTAVTGGSTITLRAQAACATTLFWSVHSGPAIRILDPEQSELTLVMPVLAADTDLVFRFTAKFADSTRYGDVRIRVQSETSAPSRLRPADRFPSGNGRKDLLPGRDGRDALGRAAPAGRRWTAFPGF